MGQSGHLESALGRTIVNSLFSLRMKILAPRFGMKNFCDNIFVAVLFENRYYRHKTRGTGIYLSGTTPTFEKDNPRKVIKFEIISLVLNLYLKKQLVLNFSKTIC